jgi:hypothetical protein
MKVPSWYHDALKVSADLGRRDVFFVIGCQKSGTTWVERLLDHHPNVCCRGEGHFSDVIAPMLEQMHRIYNEDRRATWEFGPDDLLASIRLVTDTIFGKYLTGCRDPQAVRMIGDKTPEGALAVPALSTLYPGARFIHVIRDGRDAAVSGWAHLRRRGTSQRFDSFADYAVYLARHHWVPYIMRARQGGRWVPNRYLEVRYEDLHDSPMDHTRRILRFLEVSAADDIVRACVHRASFRALSGRDAGDEDPSSHFRKGIVGDWVNRFDETTLRRFEAVAGPLLHELGYSTAAPVATAA